MLRMFRVPGAIAAATILALAAAQPAEAAGGRAEARGKAARVAAPARASVRPAATASRRPVVVAPRSRSASAAPARAVIRTASRGSARVVTASRGGRIQARAAGRREARIASSRRQVFNYAGRRQVALNGRPGIRMVGLFSAPAAASTLPSNGWKSGKPARARGEGSSRRSGVWFTGLPAADGEQMDCPAGTMAVLARGHSDTFRCMPM